MGTCSSHRDTPIGVVWKERDLPPGRKKIIRPDERKTACLDSIPTVRPDQVLTEGSHALRVHVAQYRLAWQSIGPYWPISKGALKLETSSSAPQFKAHTANGHGKVELFVEQLKEIASKNQWLEKSCLLHPKGCLEGLARSYGKRDLTVGILKSLQTRFGTSAQ